MEHWRERGRQQAAVVCSGGGRRREWLERERSAEGPVRDSHHCETDSQSARARQRSRHNSCRRSTSSRAPWSPNGRCKELNNLSEHDDRPARTGCGGQGFTSWPGERLRMALCGDYCANVHAQHREVAIRPADRRPACLLCRRRRAWVAARQQDPSQPAHLVNSIPGLQPSNGTFGTIGTVQANARKCYKLGIRSGPPSARQAL